MPAGLQKLFSAAADGRGESLYDGCGNWSFFACRKAKAGWALGLTIDTISLSGTFKIDALVTDDQASRVANSQQRCRVPSPLSQFADLPQL